MKNTWIWILAVIVIAGGLIWYFASEKINTGPEFVHDLIKVESPRASEVIKSPLTVKGEARGNWYFEASFPVKLLDANGNNVPLNPPYIMTANEWMTADFVPFETTLTFTPPATDTGMLVFQKDNPSGLPENEDELAVPVRFR